jgi:hypothetical protein
MLPSRDSYGSKSPSNKRLATGVKPYFSGGISTGSGSAFNTPPPSTAQFDLPSGISGYSPAGTRVSGDDYGNYGLPDNTASAQSADLDKHKNEVHNSSVFAPEDLTDGIGLGCDICNTLVEHRAKHDTLQIKGEDIVSGIERLRCRECLRVQHLTTHNPFDLSNEPVDFKFGKEVGCDRCPRLKSHMKRHTHKSPLTTTEIQNGALQGCHQCKCEALKR